MKSKISFNKINKDQIQIKINISFIIIIIIISEAIMILSSSKEFERYSNPEIQERPQDNVEVPQVDIYTKIH